MTTEMFLIALGVGSALIAFWLALRFPERGPGDFQRALLHVGLAIGCGWFAGDVFAALVSFGYFVVVTGVFVVVLPVLVYTFLASAWLLRLAHDALVNRRF